MHPLAKKLMMARKLDFGEDGRAEMLDQPVFLMEGSFLAEIEKNVDQDQAFQIGKETGIKMEQDIGKTGLSGIKMVEFMMDLLTMSGLGEFELNKFDLDDQQGEVRVRNSLIGREAKKRGNESNCSLISGILSGIFSESFEKEMEATEFKCISQGSEVCRFRVD